MSISEASAFKEQPLYTVKLVFNVDGSKSKKILSTAWLFKIVCHKLLSKSKQIRDILVSSRVAWIKMFKNHVYDIIPNKRYSYGVIHLVYGTWESAGKLNIDYNNVELSDWLLFRHHEREINSNVVRVYEDGSALITVYGYDGLKD